MASTEQPAANVDQDMARFLTKKEELEVDKIFRALVKLEGSDLHMKVGRPPIVRINGSLKDLNRGPIEREEMVRLLFPMMDKKNRKIFEEEGGADFAHTVDVDGETWRFRVNMLTQLGNIGLVARRISNWIPDFRGLHLPPVMESLCHYDQGMVLLAGVTGSGKSTTIASMLNYINSIYSKHILTLEDPIEFVYTEDKCLINQREVGQDVKDFEIAMKHAVREDPDIILVGVSRTSKTPTSIYLANKGLKTSNIPLVNDMSIPNDIVKSKTLCVIGLTTEAERLYDIRRNRLNSLKENEASDYTDLEKIRLEVEQSKKIFKINKWPTIDVTRKSVEETAASIIKIFEIQNKNG